MRTCWFCGGGFKIKKKIKGTGFILLYPIDSIIVNVVLVKGGEQLKGFYTVNKSYFDHLLPVVGLQITKNINSGRAVSRSRRIGL